MTDIAIGASTQVLVIKESVYGTTPSITPGDTKVIPFVSTGLNLTRSIIEDPTIRGDRTNNTRRSGNNEVGGDIQMSLSYGNVDEFLESALYDEFTAVGSPSVETIFVGNSDDQVSLTVEVGHTDIDEYRLFTGVLVDQLSFEFNTDGYVNLTATMVGQDMTVNSTSLDSAPTSSLINDPFVHFDGTFLEGGTTDECITSATVNIQNNIARNYCLGNRDAVYLTSSLVSVTGTIEVYFKDSTMINKFLDETDSSLEFTLTDLDGNVYKLVMPKVRYITNDVSVSDSNVIPISFEFEALDDGTNGPIYIERVPA